MRVSFKIIGIIWGILLLILGSLVYMAYSKLNPDALVSMMKEQVERVSPGSELQIGSIDYRFSVDFKLDLKDITLVNSGQKIGSIEEIQIKLPWWLFLTNSGSAQINLSRLDFKVPKSKPAAKSGTVMATDGDHSKVKLIIPSYLSSAKYTIRAKDIIIRDEEDSHRYFNLRKLLVREFQYGKTSVFELTLPIEINHNSAKYNSELWLFGDLNPAESSWSINYRGEFKTRDVADKFQLEDLTIDGKATMVTSNFQISSGLQFLIEKQVVGHGSVQLGEDKLNVGLQFQRFPLSYLSIIDQEIKNPYMPMLEGYGQGQLTFAKVSGEPSTLISKVDFEGMMLLGSDRVYAGKWLLSFDNTKWETSFITPNGEVSFFRRSLVDLDKGTVVQYNEEVGFSGIELQKALAAVKGLTQFREEPSLAYYSSVSSFKDCLQGERKVNGQIKYGRSPDLRFYQVDLSDSQGNFEFAYQGKGEAEQVSFKAREFSWEGFPILEPYFNMSVGILNGSLQGKWNQEWSKGDWKVDLKMTGVDAFSGQLMSMQQKLLQIFDVAPTPVTAFNLKTEMTKEKMLLTNLAVEGETPLRLTGTLGPGSSSSQLTLHHPKNKAMKPIKKELNQFPF